MRQRGQNENQIGIYGPSDQESRENPENKDIGIRGRQTCPFGTGCGVKNAPVKKMILVCTGTPPIRLIENHDHTTYIG